MSNEYDVLFFGVHGVYRRTRYEKRLRDFAWLSNEMRGKCSAGSTTPPFLANIFVTRMLTRDLLAVGNVVVAS